MDAGRRDGAGRTRWSAAALGHFPQDGIFGCIVELAPIYLRRRIGPLPDHRFPNGLVATNDLAVAQLVPDPAAVGNPMMGPIIVSLQMLGQPIFPHDHNPAIPPGCTSDLPHPFRFGQGFCLTYIVDSSLTVLTGHRQYDAVGHILAEPIVGTIDILTAYHCYPTGNPDDPDSR